MEQPKKLSLMETKEILALTEDDLSLDLIRDLFACRLGQANPKYSTYDEMTIPAGTVIHGWTTPTAIKTTIGRYIVNNFILPTSYLKKYGFYNDTLTKKNLGKLESNMGTMVFDNEMAMKEYTEYLDKGEWISMGSAYFLDPSLDYQFNNPIPEVIAKRDELFEKYKDKINAGDSATIDKLEKELVEMARKKIKEEKNESYDFYDSGIGEFDNHYKKMSIMNGAIANPYTGKVNVIKSNLMDGLKAEEVPDFAALTVQGGMARGVDTQLSGYERKKIDNAMQVVELDEEGTDCGTNFTLDITIPESLKDLFLYRYVVEDDIRKPTLITKANLSKFVGKPIKLRSPMFCKGDHICSKCAGEMFYKIGTKYAGLTTNQMAGAFLNICMKKFHDATVKYIEIDPDKFIKKH